MKPPIPQPAGVIFDMDGVLCDTRLYHLRAFQELLEPHGLTLSAEQFQHLFGMENRKLIPHLFGQELPEETVLERADWKEARYREIIGRDITLMAGVAELFAWLREQKRPTAVASSAPRANVEQILRTTGLIHQVDAYLGSEDVRRHKPHPDVFLTAAERIGVEPSTAWVIEDSLHGIEAGLAAGMTVLGVATTHPASELSPAHAVYADVAEIYSMLKDCR